MNILFNHISKRCIDAHALAAGILLRKEHEHEHVRGGLLAYMLKQIAEHSREFKTMLAQNCTIDQEDVEVALSRKSIKGQFLRIFLRTYNALGV